MEQKLNIIEDIWNLKDLEIIEIAKSIELSNTNQQNIQEIQNNLKNIESSEKDVLQILLNSLQEQKFVENQKYQDSLQTHLIKGLLYEYQNDFIQAQNVYFDISQKQELNRIQKVLIMIKISLYQPIKKIMTKSLKAILKEEKKMIQQDNYLLLKNFFFPGQLLFLAHVFEFETLYQEIIVKKLDILIKENEFEYYYGMVLIEQDKFEEGKKILQNLDERIAESNMVIHCQINKILGNAYFNQKKYQKALKQYEQVEKIFSKDIDLLNNIGCCHQNLGDFVQAEKYFKNSKSINPKFVETHIYIGQMYEESEEYEQAEKIYNYVVKNFPDEPEGYVSLAEMYMDEAKDMQAKKLLEKAVQLDPTNRNVYVNFGKLYENLHDFPKSIENYNIAMQIDPQYADSYYECGSIYEQMGDFEKAIQLYEQAVQKDNDFSEAWMALGQNYEIEEYRNIEKAIQAYRNYARVKSDDTEALMTLAEVLIDNNQKGEAIKYLVECYILDENFDTQLQDEKLKKTVEQLVEFRKQNLRQQEQAKYVVQVIQQNGELRNYDQKFLRDIAMMQFQ